MIVQYDTFDLNKSDTIQYDKIVYKATKGCEKPKEAIWDWCDGIGCDELCNMTQFKGNKTQWHTIQCNETRNVSILQYEMQYRTMYATLWCDKISYVSSPTGKETKTASNPASLGSSISGNTNKVSNFGLFDKDELSRPVA